MNLDWFNWQLCGNDMKVIAGNSGAIVSRHVADYWAELWW